MRNAVSASPVVYSAVLRPHRSAGVSAARLVALLMLAVWTVVGIAFIVAGAWPVVPFLGLEVALLYGALRLNDFAGNASETINLTANALTVRRIDHWGRQQNYSFPPYWLQVNMPEPPEWHTPIELRSRGRSLAIGKFILPHERVDVAHALRRELARLSRSGATLAPDDEGLSLYAKPSTARME